MLQQPRGDTALRLAHKISRRALLAGAAGVVGAAGLAPLKTVFAQEAPRAGGVLRIGMTRRPNHLNPLRAINDAEYMLAEMLYSSLTRLDYTMRPVPDLAVLWEYNKDLTEWTFRLRTDAQFHSGREVTAEDVVATFEAILDPATASPGRAQIGPVSKVTMVDRYTVRFTTSGPYADLPVTLAYYNAKIVPADIVARNVRALDATVHGSGPFRLKQFEPGRVLVVERNPNYYVRSRPYLERVEQIVYPDPTGLLAAFLNREIDLVTEVPPPEYGRILRTPGVDALRQVSGQFVNMVLRHDQRPFNDHRVRRALQLALDREQLVALLLEGYGTTAGDTPISAAYRYYKALPPISRNLQEARNLLAEAGYPNGLRITLYAAESPPIRARLGVAVREMARPVGFDINVQTVAYDTYLSQIWRKANFYVGFYAMRPTEDQILRLLYTSDAAWNETQWNNARFDDLVNRARATTSVAQRRELYGQAQEMMRREVPAVIPVFMDLLAAKQAYVRNYRLHPLGTVHYLDRVWLAEGAPRR